MKKFSPQFVFSLLLILWFVINIFQATYTEIIDDEAYYYLYGKYLAWGYYDHPPMIGLIVKISSLFFYGNLGVRFITLILHVATLLLIWKIIGEKELTTKKVFIFFIIASSLVMFSAYGFITTADSPLLFFTALFLLVYKNYLKENSFINILFLSISIAGLIYSKYQSVLLIGFILLSNLKVLKDKKIWLSLLFVLILLIPHIYWQIENDFPSFRYHLVGRSKAFRWSYFWEYIPNQLVVFSPFTLIVLIIALRKYPVKDTFEKGLYFVIIGMILFFWLTSLRGHVEPHWTVLCSIPMIILLYRRAVQYEKIEKLTYRIILPSLLLIIAARIILITDILPEKLGFHGKKEKAEFIHKIAGDTPVIFTGSFQQASLYSFFTGKSSSVISNIESRQTQFDIWQFEKGFQGEEVFIFDKEIDTRYNRYRKKQIIDTINKIKYPLLFVDSLQTTNRMIIDYLISNKYKAGDTIRTELVITNPYPYRFYFNHEEFPVSIFSRLSLKKADIIIPVQIEENTNVIDPYQSITKKVEIAIPKYLSGNKIKIVLGFRSYFGYTANSHIKEIYIE